MCSRFIFKESKLLIGKNWMFYWEIISSIIYATLKCFSNKWQNWDGTKFLSPDLNIDVIWSILKELRNLPQVKESFIMSHKTLTKYSKISINNFTGILSELCFVNFKFLIKREHSFSVTGAKNIELWLLEY